LTLYIRNFFQFWTLKLLAFVHCERYFLLEADICSKVLPALITVGLPNS